MNKQKIKPLPIVKAYADYFLTRAKRILKLKKSEYDATHIDFHEARFTDIDVWFFTKTNVLARVRFTSDGKLIDKDDIIDKRKRNGRKKDLV